MDESLPPRNIPILERLGILEEVASMGVLNRAQSSYQMRLAKRRVRLREGPGPGVHKRLSGQPRGFR